MPYKESLSAVAIALTFIAFLPYARSTLKGATRPHNFSLFSARNLVVIMALENYSVTTVLFPTVIAIACVLLVAMLTYRRRVLAS